MKLTPRIPLTDPRFAYTSSVHTDIRKRFAAIRREREEQKARIASGAQDGHLIVFDQRRREGK